MGDPPGLDPPTIEARIRAYASFGHHRTGWPGDDRTTAWLLDELRARGIGAESQRFRFPRLEVRAAALSWDDERVDGEPMYDSGLTRAGGITTELADEGDYERFGKIVLASSAARERTPWTAADVRAHYEALTTEGVVGAVVPTADPLGELRLRNAEHIERPFAQRVLQIAQRDARRLSTAVVMRREVTLEIDADRLESSATNVTATIPGDDSEAAPLVVMTPKSGWFACAGERGGGIAAWLAIAETVARLPVRRRTVHLVATSGHELHRRGVAAYLGQHAGLARGALCWVHLGSAIGALEASPRLGASDGALLAVAERALDGAGVGEYERLDPGDPGFGEARDVHEAGGRFVTVHGLHPFMHSPNDTFDVAVDPLSVARWARATWEMVRTLIEKE